jgi:hypothetical protein
LLGDVRFEMFQTRFEWAKLFQTRLEQPNFGGHIVRARLRSRKCDEGGSRHGRQRHPCIERLHS